MTVWVLGAAFVVRWIAVAAGTGPHAAPPDPDDQVADLVQDALEHVYGPRLPGHRGSDEHPRYGRPPEPRGDSEAVAGPKVPR